jgi:enoyl-CoA hydratase/carnithine racemase
MSTAEATSTHVHYERDGDLAVVTLDSQPGNFFDDPLIDGLSLAFDQAYEDRVRALMLNAAGPNFCGGANVKIFQGVDRHESRAKFSKFLPLMQRLEDMPFPTLASVHGLCLAAGLEIALCCDLIWAGESAQFAQVEALIGTTTLLGGVHRLAERAGSARAKEITFSGDFYPAATFERWNIINQLVPDEELATRSLEYAQRLANGPTVAHNATKRMVRAWLDSGVVAADRLILDVGTAVFESQDMINNVETLLEQGARSQRDNARFEGK